MPFSAGSEADFINRLIRQGLITEVGGSIGAASGAWFAQQQVFITSLLPSVNTPVIAHEMQSVAPDFGVTEASTATSRSLGSEGGVIRVQSGATAGSSTTLRTIDGTAASPAQQVSNLRTSVYAIAVRAKKVAVNATCDLRILQMGDEATTDVRVGIAGATSQTNYIIKVGAGGAVDTGVIQSATYDDLVLTADGTNFRLYVNGVLASTQAQVGVGAVGGHFFAFCANGGTASNAGFDLDKLLIMTTAAV